MSPEAATQMQFERYRQMTCEEWIECDKEAGRLQVFKQLQSRLQLTPDKAVAWQSSVREGRR